MKDLIIGSHLLFARAGEVIDGVTVAQEAKPDTTPSSNYTAFPTVSDWEPRFEMETVKRRAPSPGKYQDRANIMLSSTIEYAFSLQQFTMTTLAELILGGEEPSSGVFVPGARSELLKGWWIVQSYDQNNDLISALNIWAEARVEPYKFGENLDDYALILTQLYSSLNTGEITNLT